MNANLYIQGLNKSFHGVRVLEDINLEFPAGELTAIIGRSGCGKSTLLRCIDGLEPFDSGRIEFNGLVDEHHHTSRKTKSLRQICGHFGMVFQSFNLFPHLTVLENVIKAPMVVKKLKRKDAEDIAIPLLKKVGLLAHKDHYPMQLSGGQQQRAAIARALALSPKVMFYDEPTSALDPWLVDEVFQVMRKLDEEGLTQIIVTHDMRFVRELAKNIILLEEGQVAEAGVKNDLLASSHQLKTQHYLSRFVG